MAEKPVRLVLAKLGLDDHIRPLQVLSYAFRDAGMEVVYLGCFQTPQTVVETAAIEDVDAIGLSFHTLSYFGWIDETMNVLKEKGMDSRVSVFVGGTIPPEDTSALEAIGVRGVFLPGVSLGSIVDQIKQTVSQVRDSGGKTV
ncbi:MAG: cobalamin-dependent protein [Thermodesulfobacteriota bacterium]